MQRFKFALHDVVCHVFDANGTFNRLRSWKSDAAAGVKIRADYHDDEDDGFAVGLSTCLTKDGRSQPTANIPMNNHKITSLGDPDDPADAANMRYVDDKFGSVFTITGVDDAGRITFAGTQSPLATGEPLGISWTQADLFFGTKPVDVETAGKLPRWVWNNQANGMGTDVMNLTEAGVLTVNGAFTTAGRCTVNSLCVSSNNQMTVATTGSGTLYLRPGGEAGTAGQMVMDTGAASINGDFTVLGTGYIVRSAAGGFLGTSLNAGSIFTSSNTTSSTLHTRYYNPNGQVGSISTAALATTFNTSSDERLKDFEGPYDPEAAIAIIRADPVRAFTWKADGSRAVGWGAQTSYAISPDLASPGEGEPGDENFAPWGIDQGRRTPYLWAALSAALDKIDALEARIAALEAAP